MAPFQAPWQMAPWQMAQFPLTSLLANAWLLMTSPALSLRPPSPSATSSFTPSTRWEDLKVVCFFACFVCVLFLCVFYYQVGVFSSLDFPCSRVLYGEAKRSVGVVFCAVDKYSNSLNPCVAGLGGISFVAKFMFSDYKWQCRAENYLVP